MRKVHGSSQCPVLDQASLSRLPLCTRSRSPLLYHPASCILAQLTCYLFAAAARRSGTTAWRSTTSPFACTTTHGCAPRWLLPSTTRLSHLPCGPCSRRCATCGPPPGKDGFRVQGPPASTWPGICPTTWQQVSQVSSVGSACVVRPVPLQAWGLSTVASVSRLAYLTFATAVSRSSPHRHVRRPVVRKPS